METVQERPLSHVFMDGKQFHPWFLCKIRGNCTIVIILKIQPLWWRLTAFNTKYQIRFDFCIASTETNTTLAPSSNKILIWIRYCIFAHQDFISSLFAWWFFIRILNALVLKLATFKCVNVTVAYFSGQKAENKGHTTEKWKSQKWDAVSNQIKNFPQFIFPKGMQNELEHKKYETPRLFITFRW